VEPPPRNDGGVLEMAYQVKIVDADFLIPAHNLPEAQEIVDTWAREHPAATNYLKCPQEGPLAERFAAIGFEVVVSTQGLRVSGFESKWIEQQEFLDLFSSVVAPDSFINFVGMDGNTFSWGGEQA
jgi:hypothetical protein